MRRYIIVSGIDGCGKTAVVNELCKRLEREGLSTRYEWMRYNHRLVKPIHGLCRLVGLSRAYEVDGRRIWRHEFYQSGLFSSCYITLTWLDVLLGRLLLEIRLLLRQVDVVVCDRWVPDVIVDLVVDTRRRGLLCGKWHERFARLLPSRVRQYVIERDRENIYACRPDVTRDVAFSFRRRLYRRLARHPGIVVVRNNGTLSTTVDTIVSDWSNRESARPLVQS